MTTLNQIYVIIYSILGLGILISTTEYIAGIKIFSSDGMLSCDVQQINLKENNHFFNRLFTALFSEERLKYIFLIRSVNIILLFIIPLNTIAGWLLLIALGISIYISSLVTRYGSDGSDQMGMLIIITLILCLVPINNPLLLNVGIWFIAIQSCLSYTVAGISKLSSVEWRTSTAMRSIFSTKTFGSRKAALFLKKHRFMNVLLCWNVMLTEALFPLCLILPLPFALVFLFWGFTFHLLNAIIMGLNSFFWAFMATYPAIIYVNLQIHHSIF
jgi:hypothetical protein